MATVRVCGHRGAAGLALENTIPSFERALALGVDAIECDVHATLDGRVAVIHDDTLDRTTPASGRVPEQTMAQLKSLGVPELCEVAELARGRAELVVEFKHGSAVAPAVACLQDMGMLDQAFFLAFDWDHLALLKTLAPQARFAALLFRVDDMLLEEALALGGDVDLHYKRVNLVVAERIHRAGRKLWVYTPNTWQHQQLMIGLGVDVLTTDRPDLLLENLNRAPAQEDAPTC